MISRRKFLIFVSSLATLGVAVAPLKVFARSKFIDKRTYSDASGNKYFLNFVSREGALGHAYVSWGIEDRRKRQSIQKSFGYYPVKPGVNNLGSVPGKIVAEDSSKRTVNSLTVQVDKKVYDRTKRATRKWSTRRYNLFARNCVRFVHDVAKKAKLKVPRRSSFRFPDSYIEELMEINRGH